MKLVRETLWNVCLMRPLQNSLKGFGSRDWEEMWMSSEANFDGVDAGLKYWIKLNQVERIKQNQTPLIIFDPIISYSLSHFAPGEVDSWPEWQRILPLRLHEMPGVFHFKSLWSVEGMHRMERPYQANDIYQVTKRHQFCIALSDFDVVVFHCIHDSMWQCCSPRRFF